MSKKKNKIDESKFLEDLKNLAEKADQTKGFTLNFEDEFDLENEDTFNVDSLKDTQDPKESHRLFYTIRGILMTNLPKGPDYKKLRDHIYDEKNIFLNRGAKLNSQGIRGSDGRMTYVSSHLKVAYETVVEWVREGANSFDIFDKFRDLNKKHGYYDKDTSGEDNKEYLSSFNKKLKKNTNPKTKNEEEE